MVTNSLDAIALERPAGEIEDREVEEEDSISPSRPVNELLLLQQIENHKADRDLRERFGNKAYRVVKKSLYGWAILLIIYGLCKFFGREVFPEKVMLAITAAVTLNVFAAFLGVIRGLFPFPKTT